MFINRENIVKNITPLKYDFMKKNGKFTACNIDE